MALSGRPDIIWRCCIETWRLGLEVSQEQQWVRHVHAGLHSLSCSSPPSAECQINHGGATTAWSRGVLWPPCWHQQQRPQPASTCGPQALAHWIRATIARLTLKDWRESGAALGTLPCSRPPSYPSGHRLPGSALCRVTMCSRVDKIYQQELRPLRGRAPRHKARHLQPNASQKYVHSRHVHTM